MRYRTTTVPEKVHSAVLKWSETYLPDFDLLLENWEKYFPRDEKYRLCAYRELGMCDEIECGAMKGQPKFNRACDMDPKQAGHLLGAIRAQASTEFGSIQQHQLTLARAQEEEEQFWVLRMAAEELRHGYQMIHLLLEDDWSSVSSDTGEQMVEEILSMKTGSHILGAFNIDFDSFVDNVVFCGLIDRVGKYQLAMQKVSAYKPMAESMPQMLREEAFHLATGVVPLRRWAEKAARGAMTITMDDIQRAFNKWLPRGLEMFGDERGGGTNVKFGLKPMKNAEAQEQYYDEVAKLIRDVNMRFVRARLSKLEPKEAEAVLDRITGGGEVVDGIAPEDLVRIPHRHFYRRRGVPAFQMIGFDGEEFSDRDAYLRHLADHLPAAYRAGRDFLHYVDALERIDRGELTRDEAGREMPQLSRVGGVCPCSRAVRWIEGNGGPEDGGPEGLEA